MDYKEIAKEARLKVLELVFKAQTSHIGSNFSCIDILTVLFEKMDLDKDQFVLSKGWAAASLYYFLWRKGRITEEELNSFCQPGSKFIGLAEPIISDIKIAGGSMGLGLPGAVGLALAKKLKGEEGEVYVLMSDGEQDIGTTHESALIARHQQLTNLRVFIDYNDFCAMGRKNEVLNIEPLVDRWISWGWNVYEINGHNFDDLENQFQDDKEPSPTVIICNTVKGYPISFMSSNNLFHYKQLSISEYQQAMVELRDEK